MRFAFEALQGRPVAFHLLRQKLQRHEAPELGVLGLVHHAHSPAAQLLNHSVVGNGFANHDGSLGRLCQILGYATALSQRDRRASSTLF